MTKRDKALVKATVRASYLLQKAGVTSNKSEDDITYIVNRAKLTETNSNVALELKINPYLTIGTNENF